MRRFLASILALMTFATLAACAPLSQDEPMGTPGDLARDGYKPAPPPRPGARDFQIPAAHSLRWPVLFQDSSHVIGNTMVQYQPYDGSYWHGGGDLRVKAGAEVRAPTRGHIEAGHYSYAINPDGSMEKYWKAWPQQGSDTYFEVAIVTDDGTRYEFHHVNRSTLPAQIIRLVEAHGEIEAGDLLGYAIRWSDGDYHHIHYNIVAPNGTRINPEYVSTTLPDDRPPQIKGAYAVMPNGSAVAFGSGQFASSPSEFVIDVVDFLGASIYQHPPEQASLVFSSGEETAWDFRKTLSLPNGAFPNLWEFFKKTLTLSTGRTLGTSGGYGMGVSLVRLKVPPAAHGAFRILLGDQNGNETELDGSIQ